MTKQITSLPSKKFVACEMHVNCADPHNRPDRKVDKPAGANTDGGSNDGQNHYGSPPPLHYVSAPMCNEEWYLVGNGMLSVASANAKITITHFFHKSFQR
jgi:hypothetical protein